MRATPRIAELVPIYRILVEAAREPERWLSVADISARLGENGEPRRSATTIRKVTDELVQAGLVRKMRNPPAFKYRLETGPLPTRAEAYRRRLHEAASIIPLPSDYETLVALWSRIPHDQRRNVIREWVHAGRPAVSWEEIVELVIEFGRVANERR